MRGTTSDSGGIDCCFEALVIKLLLAITAISLLLLRLHLKIFDMLFVLV